jgi:hypothetical protein
MPIGGSRRLSSARGMRTRLSAASAASRSPAVLAPANSVSILRSFSRRWDSMLIGRPRTNGSARNPTSRLGRGNQPVVAVHRTHIGHQYHSLAPSRVVTCLMLPSQARKPAAVTGRLHMDCNCRANCSIGGAWGAKGSWRGRRMPSSLYARIREAGCRRMARCRRDGSRSYWRTACRSWWTGIPVIRPIGVHPHQ